MNLSVTGTSVEFVAAKRVHGALTGVHGKASTGVDGGALAAVGNVGWFDDARSGARRSARGPAMRWRGGRSGV